MKYFVMLGDGMADDRLEELGGRTPLEAARKPQMDFLAAHGQNGVCKTVPDDMVPESDTANLAILGYDPRKYSKGRSPLESVSMGLTMTESEYAFRCNLVALSGDGEYEDKTMADNTAGEISTDEADELIRAIHQKLGDDRRGFYTGISYRHCMLWDNPPGYDREEKIYPFVRPHDIIGRTVRDYLPSGPIGGQYAPLFRESYEILRDHPVNKKRIARGKLPANSIWLWSPGKKPQLQSFYEKYRVRGAVISAVDLIKGIGICAGMQSINVEGATGNYHTNYAGKAEAAIERYRAGTEFIYLHVEAPDECGHAGQIEEKVKSIEKIDSLILKKVKEYLDGTGEHYRILLMPDHLTPVKTRTHAPGAVPFVIYDNREERSEGIVAYSEREARKTGLRVEIGHRLLEDYFIR